MPQKAQPKARPSSKVKLCSRCHAEPTHPDSDKWCKWCIFAHRLYIREWAGSQPYLPKKVGRKPFFPDEEVLGL